MGIYSVQDLRISYTSYSLGPPLFWEPPPKNCPSEQLSYILKYTTALFVPMPHVRNVPYSSPNLARLFKEQTALVPRVCNTDNQLTVITDNYDYRNY